MVIWSLAPHTDAAPSIPLCGNPCHFNFGVLDCVLSDACFIKVNFTHQSVFTGLSGNGGICEKRCIKPFVAPEGPVWNLTNCHNCCHLRFWLKTTSLGMKRIGRCGGCLPAQFAPFEDSLKTQYLSNWAIGSYIALWVILAFGFGEEEVCGYI